MILLGFLETPASGYDLKKAFDESVRHFWDAELSQIYPSLHRLHREGLVSFTTEPSDRGPDRKVYARTPAGLEVFRQWLAAGPVVGDQRIGHLAQLFFLGQFDDAPRTRSFLEELRAVFGRRLAALCAIESHVRDANGELSSELTTNTVHPYLTLRYGIRRMEATVAWCDESLHLLARLEDAEAGPL